MMKHNKITIALYIFLFILTCYVFFIWLNLVATLPFLTFSYTINDDRVIITDYFHSNIYDKEKLKNNDILINFGGIDITSKNKGTWYWNAYKKGIIKENIPISIVIERKGEIKNYQITPINIGLNLNGDIIASVYQFILFSILSFIIFLKSLKHTKIRIPAFIFLASSIFFSYLYYPDIFIRYIDLIRLMLFKSSFLLLPLLLHFSFIFPDENNVIKKYPFSKIAIYLPFIILLCYDYSQELYIHFFNDGIRISWLPLFEWYREPRFIGGLIIILTFIIVVLYSYIKAKSEAIRSYFEWFASGTIVGIIPLFILKSIAFILSIHIPNYYSVFFLSIVPLAFTIGIFKMNRI